jgi:transcription initiation factor TFIIE subunit alpha
MRRLLEALEERREYELENEFYLCEQCSLRFEFGEAMDFGFECPNCGSQLVDMDNARLIDAMDERIERLREELNVPAEDREGRAEPA